MKSFFIGNLEVKRPVIQGGIGVGVSLSELASAVANEESPGVISCAGLDLIHHKAPGNYLDKCISELKEEGKEAREKQKHNWNKHYVYNTTL